MAIDQDKVGKLLVAKGAVLPCHRCGHKNFAVIDSYSSFGLQDSFTQGVMLGGPSLPVALVGCTNCGAITAHALGVLGLLDAPKKEG